MAFVSVKQTGLLKVPIPQLIRLEGERGRRGIGKCGFAKKKMKIKKLSQHKLSTSDRRKQFIAQLSDTL